MVDAEGFLIPPLGTGYLHKRAPGHWKVQYTADIVGKCTERAWSRPLPLVSEMEDRYRGQSLGAPMARALPDKTDGKAQHYKFKHHVTDTSTKFLPSSTTNKSYSGCGEVPGQGSVREHLQPYLSTVTQQHKYFTPRHLHHISPSTDMATYWLCQDYPKAWGFGAHSNPLDGAEGHSRRRTQTDRLGLQRSRVREPELPRSLTRFMHNGLQSEYAGAYSNNSFC